MATIDTEAAARQVARAIASDVAIYNPAKIQEGLENDDLFDRMAEEIEEGRAFYKKRVSPELYPKNLYERAIVDVLLKGKAHLKCKAW